MLTRDDIVLIDMKIELLRMSYEADKPRILCRLISIRINDWRDRYTEFHDNDLDLDILRESCVYDVTTPLDASCKNIFLGSELD